MLSQIPKTNPNSSPGSFFNPTKQLSGNLKVSQTGNPVPGIE